MRTFPLSGTLPDVDPDDVVEPDDVEPLPPLELPLLLPLLLVALPGATVPPQASRPQPRKTST